MFLIFAEFSTRVRGTLDRKDQLKGQCFSHGWEIVA